MRKTLSWLQLVSQAKALPPESLHSIVRIQTEVIISTWYRCHVYGSHVRRALITQYEQKTSEWGDSLANKIELTSAKQDQKWPSAKNWCWCKIGIQYLWVLLYPWIKPTINQKYLVKKIALYPSCSSIIMFCLTKYLESTEPNYYE